MNDSQIMKSPFLDSDPKIQELKKQLTTAIQEHIERQVTNPAVSFLDTDFLAQDDLASLLIMNKAVKDLIDQEGSGKLDKFSVNALKREEVNNLTDL